jgi:hypothetical protein
MIKYSTVKIFARIDMPPRPHRESPERQAGRIRKHVDQAQEYWAKGLQHVREKDTCQAAEKGWGTVAQLAKAVATMHGWNHYDHIAIRECVIALAEENPGQEREIRRGLLLAEGLHGQFYEVYMDLGSVQVALEDVVPLLEILWNLLPDDYTGARTFVEQDSI